MATDTKKKKQATVQEPVPVAEDMPKAQVIGEGETTLAEALKIVLPAQCADVGVTVARADSDGEINGLDPRSYYMLIRVQDGVKVIDNGEAETGSGIMRRTVMFMADRKKAPDA